MVNFFFLHSRIVSLHIHYKFRDNSIFEMFRNFNLLANVSTLRYHIAGGHFLCPLRDKIFSQQQDISGQLWTLFSAENLQHSQTLISIAAATFQVQITLRLTFHSFQIVMFEKIFMVLEKYALKNKTSKCG